MNRRNRINLLALGVPVCLVALLAIFAVGSAPALLSPVSGVRSPESKFTPLPFDSGLPTPDTGLLPTEVDGQGQDYWPRFRGPNADGVAADDVRLPDAWNKTKNVRWVADVPGWGVSSPVVWGDRVFLTTVVSDGELPKPKKGLYQGDGVRKPPKGVHHWLVFCFDLKSGKELWRHEAHSGEPMVPRHPKSSYASETPTTDGKRLYVLFGDLGLFCYDLDGKPLWSHKVQPMKTQLDYGAAASPVVHEGQVLMLYDNQETSYLAAYDVETGKEALANRTSGNDHLVNAFPCQSIAARLVVCSMVI